VFVRWFLGVRETGEIIGMKYWQWMSSDSCLAVLGQS